MPVEIVPNETIAAHLKRISNIDNKKIEELVEITSDNKTLNFKIPLKIGKYLVHSMEAAKSIKMQEVINNLLFIQIVEVDKCERVRKLFEI